jgi:hypothetical protein
MVPNIGKQKPPENQAAFDIGGDIQLQDRE